MRLHRRCATCGLVYLHNAGDAWGFLLVVDRLFFILPVVAAIYFGVFTGPVWVPATVLGTLAVVFFRTMRPRYGLCVALDYLARCRWGDPADPLPPLPDPDCP